MLRGDQKICAWFTVHRQANVSCLTLLFTFPLPTFLPFFFLFFSYCNKKMSLLKQSKYYAYSQAIPIDSEQHPDDRIRRRMCSTYSQSSTTTSALSSRPAIFELLFTKLLDALIFTSAIAITAYNYLMGALDNSPNTPQPAPIVDIKQWRQANTAYRLPSPTTATTRIPEHHHQHHHDFLQDSKRERTLQWAETVARTTSKPRSVQLPPRHQVKNSARGKLCFGRM